MDSLEILQFICSQDETSYTTSDEDMFKAQQQYYSMDNHDIWFDPLIWLCSNAQYFFSKCKLVYTTKNDRTPCSAFYNNECLFHDNLMKQSSLNVICKFYIEHKCKWPARVFDASFYYSMYHESIDLFEEIYNVHQQSPKKINNPPLLFYIMYGFWNNLHLKAVNGLVYIASNPSFFVEKYGTYTNNALKNYYAEDTKPKLTFEPFTYAASNHDRVKMLFESCQMCTHENKNRLTKHYIRTGYPDKLSVNSFNKWNYLANNYKRIRSLMPRNKKGQVIWDLYFLTSERVAQDYIKRIQKTNKNTFDEVNFVKTYIDNEYVNASKKLTIENASKYFVIYYVLCKQVRYEKTYTSKLIDFIQGRAIDTMKQIPLNASRFVIETKCL